MPRARLRQGFGGQAVKLLKVTKPAIEIYFLEQIALLLLQQLLRVVFSIHF